MKSLSIGAAGGRVLFFCKIDILLTIWILIGKLYFYIIYKIAKTYYGKAVDIR